MEKTSLKVGIKYCGGCNPTFNRVEFVKDLTASLDVGVRWVSFEEEGFSCLLIVNGCETACANVEKIEDRKLRIFSVSQKESGVKETFKPFILGGCPND